ncbi:MAG TPA: MurT ligase domain-containing protein [Propionibacteriaceae bacterium]|nr:MurT ligase domain-containing protein [Propionibacteriaceae bacterium]
MLRIDPEAFGKLLRHRRIAAVSGTNGKTTTTHLLTAAVRASLPDGDARVVTNADGANLFHGIASALGEHPRADVAILETDERVVRELIRQGRPELLVLLNFSRDQLDRHHEIKALGRSWREALIEAGESGPVVVANAADPLVVWAAAKARRAIWVDTGDGWTQDAALCPECGAVLVHEPATDSSRAHWHCPACGLAQPAPDYVVQGDDVTARGGAVHHLDLQVPGRFNRANAACALAAAVEFGVRPEDTLRGMHEVTSPAGRYATAHFGTTTARLLLAKNPAGWAESLPLAASDPVILAIDSAAADGRDVSWLWDVDYEQLAGRHVVCTGPRAQDLAVRLSYAGVDHTVEPSLAAALTNRDATVDCIATYTPFQRLRRLGGLA